MNSKSIPSCPDIPQSLVRYLKHMFPEKSPSPGETYSELMVRAGNAEVVRHIVMQYDRQNEVQYED